MIHNKVINTNGYSTSEGFADQITLPNGKFAYMGVDSIYSFQARRNGWECKKVEYFGACGYCNINATAHIKFPIQIDGVSVVNFFDKIATEEEIRDAFGK